MTITYNSPYVRYGAAGCVAGALILLVLFLLKRLSVGVRKKLSSIVAVAALGLAGGIICFFFVFPLVLCLRNSAVAVFNALF